MSNTTTNDWACVVRTMRDEAHREYKRWNNAAWDAANARGTSLVTDDPTVTRCLNAMRRCSYSVEVLSMILALEEAGRDVANLDAEILSCFNKTDAHKVSTIAHRLFKTNWHESDWYEMVERSLRRLEKDGKLFTRPHEKTYETLYMLATPERVKARKAEKERRVAQVARQKSDLARREALLERLHAQGYTSASEEHYEDDQIVLSINDVERLLAVRCSFSESACAWKGGR